MIKTKQTINLLHIVLPSREILLLLLPSVGDFSPRDIRSTAGISAMLSLFCRFRIFPTARGMPGDFWCLAKEFLKFTVSFPAC